MAENLDEVEDYVVFTDEEGIERKFTPIYEVDYEDNTYVLLEPTELYDGIEEGEVIICKIVFDDDDSDNYSLEVVMDEKEADAVFNLFMEEVENGDECGCGCDDCCDHEHHHGCDCGCDCDDCN